MTEPETGSDQGTFQIPDINALIFPDLLKTYMQPAVTVIAEQLERYLLELYERYGAADLQHP